MRYFQYKKTSFSKHSLSLLFFFIFLSIIILPLSASGKTIVLGTTEWLPYVQKADNKGYAYDIVYSAFKQAGYNDIKIIFMPWADAVEAVNSGQIDAIFPEYFSKERTQHILYTHSFSDSPVGFYKKIHSGVHFPNSNPTQNLVSTFDSMKAYRFGVVKDYVNLAVFDNDTQLNKIYTDSDLDNLKQLYNGKVDLIFIDKYTAEYLLHHELPSDYCQQLVFMYPPLAYKKLYVGVSKKNSKAKIIASDFNKGLAVIKKNGIFSEIMDRDAENTDEHIG